MTTSSDIFEIDRNPNPVTDDVRAAILADPGFGRYFTDHMAQVSWTAERGWHDAKVTPYAPLAMNPATNFIHYGQSIFEGLKAYRRADGTVGTFRPDQNAARFRRSAQRLAMAQLPDELFIGSVEALLAADSEWVPSGDDKSLYLRPFMFGTEVGLGVKPSSSYTYLVIASPAGAYFPQGIKPVSVWLSYEYVRAAPGGTGEAKCAGNYAASLVAQAEAADNGCDQVVWLDSAEHRYIEEMGGMNLFFVYGSGADARIVTPELTGALLEGVTRASLLTLARDLGYSAKEERISVEDWRKGVESGEITEVFACGTAAVITPVGTVKSRGADSFGFTEPGPVTMQLRKSLLDIQTGAAPDTYGWIHEVAV